MKLEDVPGRYYGFSADTAAPLAHAAAERDAITLTALTGSIYHPNTTIIEEVSRQILDRSTSFAIHARRALEIYNICDVLIEGGRWRFTQEIDDLNEETNLWTAVNRILHARHLQIFIGQRRPAEIFRDAGHEWVAMHLEILSDRGERIHVSPFAAAYAYLNAVAGHVRRAHREGQS